VARKTVPLIVTAVVGVVVIGAIKFATSAGHDDASNQSHTSTSLAHPRKGCDKFVVAASSEKAALLGKLANSYIESGRKVDGKCFDPVVVSVASGTAEADLARGWNTRVDGPRPDVWTPAASTWVGLLKGDLTRADKADLVPAKSESIVSTPLVLAMPKPMAQALGWPKKQLGWSDVAALAQDPSGWASVGHPEWGRFRLGKTNPTISTSGLAATVGTFVAATGRSSDLTDRDLADPKVRTFAANMERAVVHYGDTTLTYLGNLQRADDAGSGLGYVSAVAVEEKSVLDYNAGNPSGDPATLGKHRKPRVPLVAIYPKEGTLYSDSPYVVLDAPWVGDTVKAGANDFASFLRTKASQKVFTDAGFRTFEGQAGTPLKSSKEVDAGEVENVLNPPSPEVLAGVRALWNEVRKPARVLLLLDVSGSMADAAGDTGASKLELAKKAVLQALHQFSDRDEVGVWVFTTDLHGKNYSQLVPVAPIKDNRGAIVKSVKTLTPLSGTPLYSAVRSAAKEMNATYDPDAINAVVVMTDGRNEYTGDMNLGRVVNELGNGSSEARLRVFSIAYGDGADLKTLRKISEASNAAAYDATDPASISKVFTAVLSNF
jgi:Ca-activated chloride channel homolog